MAEGNGSNGPGKADLSFLRVAFQRGKTSQTPLDRQPQKVESPHILRNIRRHKHVPILAPKGAMRQGPDRQAFLHYEGLDRVEAIKRRKAMDRSAQFNKTKSDKDHEL
ncbi:hypothetical protein [Cohaesibacter celericrescens]|uniref:Uncharacterized protein n=1 Tax=Cohaesibacter celericrescens TaxID=2067669 RepID=A0A2N5XPN1_9HYPH|nr:hypothetical protein [Cohaesibacter celericrescens]PLW76435.1 hypothetical protein C0081_16300 [Cohaesibacter celericrescens]